jgi:hypothetical protein
MAWRPRRVGSLKGTAPAGGPRDGTGPGYLVSRITRLQLPERSVTLRLAKAAIISRSQQCPDEYELIERARAPEIDNILPYSAQTVANLGALRSRCLRTCRPLDGGLLRRCGHCSHSDLAFREKRNAQLSRLAFPLKPVKVYG